MEFGRELSARSKIFRERRAVFPGDGFPGGGAFALHRFRMGWQLSMVRFAEYRLLRKIPEAASPGCPAELARRRGPPCNFPAHTPPRVSIAARPLPRRSGHRSALAAPKSGPPDLEKGFIITGRTADFPCNSLLFRLFRFLCPHRVRHHVGKAAGSGNTRRVFAPGAR